MLEIKNQIGLWAHREYQRRHWIWKKPLFQKLEELYLSFLEWLFPRCWEKGCTNKGEPCVLRGYSSDDGEDFFYWYCAEHSQRHGFCFGCGEFWGGTESFEFGPGYCSNCATEFEEEENEEPHWMYEL